MNISCVSELKNRESVQLTNSKKGHMLHHNGVFSKNNQWIVFDTRNDETKIGETSEIGIVNPYTREEKIIYHTYKPTKYGPGVGGASFSPKEDSVIFIHGLSTANKEKPYGFTRRTGVAVDLNKPFEPIFMDARDITFPYIAGSLRGGTHSHCWSPDGRLISFTYNDEFVDPDLRPVWFVIILVSIKDLIFSILSNNVDKKHTPHLLSPDNFMVFFPADGHKPCMKVDTNEKVRKVVVKIPYKNQ